MRYLWLGLFLIVMDALLGARLSTGQRALALELAGRAEPYPFAVSHEPFQEHVLDNHLRDLLGHS